MKLKEIKKIILEKNKKFELKFDEENHKYFIENNLELLSVTSKISKFFPFDFKKVSRVVAEKNWVTENEVQDEWNSLRDYGSYIHELAEKYCNNEELDKNELDDIVHVIDFFEDHKNYEIIASEIQIFSKDFGVAGTIDLILKDKETNRLFIVDWKTSRKNIDRKQVWNYAKKPFEELPNNKFYSY